MAETPLTCYAQTMPGVEKIAWLEIKTRLPGVRFGEYLFAEEQNGVVTFDYDGPPADLLQLRTAEDVFLLALSIPKVTRTRADLRLITEEVERSDSFGRAAHTLLRQRHLSGPPTYRVISRLYGRHLYLRKELEQAVLKGLAARYGRRWRLVDDDANVEVWANLFGSHFVVGLRLSDRAMRHRFAKVVETPAALRPSVAAALVWLTDPQPGDVFLDPLCGSGTILMERAMAGNGTRMTQTDADSRGLAGGLLGGDIEPRQVHAAYRNLATLTQPTHPISNDPRYPRHPRPTLFRWDTCRLPLAAGSVDKVATNLPFGKQIGSPADVLRLYPGFFAELERVLKPGGRAVVLSSEYELVKDVVRGRPGLAIQTGYSIAILGQWARIYVVKRQV